MAKQHLKTNALPQRRPCFSHKVNKKIHPVGHEHFAWFYSRNFAEYEVVDSPISMRTGAKC